MGSPNWLERMQRMALQECEVNLASLEPGSYEHRMLLDWQERAAEHGGLVKRSRDEARPEAHRAADFMLAAMSQPEPTGVVRVLDFFDRATIRTALPMRSTVRFEHFGNEVVEWKVGFCVGPGDKEQWCLSRYDGRMFDQMREQSDSFLKREVDSVLYNALRYYLHNEGRFVLRPSGA